MQEVCNKLVRGKISAEYVRKVQALDEEYMNTHMSEEQYNDLMGQIETWRDHMLHGGGIVPVH